MKSASHTDLGALGEELACQHLRRRGFELIARNFRTHLGELDVIATRADLLIICEVKTRRSRNDRELPDPMLSLHPIKCRQVRRMAGAWFATLPQVPLYKQIRFDAIGIVLDERGRLLQIDHREGAF